MHIGSATAVAVLSLLSLFRSAIFGCLCVRLSAAESSGVSGRQVAGRYWGFCDELLVLEGNTIFLLVWIRISESIQTT